MKRWGGFLLCLLLSAVVWFVHVLSQSYSTLVSIPVLAVSNIEGRSSVSSSEVMVSARCASSGYRLFKLSSVRKGRHVFTDSSDFLDDGHGGYRISATNMARYVPELFGDDVILESFVEDGFLFNFGVEEHKKVPVEADFTIVYRPQYMALHDLSLKPDSVTVYGDPSLLARVDRVRTRQLTFYDVHAHRHGAVGLDAPKGIRLSSDEVMFSMDVTRYVEMPVTVTVGTVNVPHGVELLVFPPAAEVKCRCVFPLAVDDLSSFRLEIDYDDFASSISGRCIPHCPSFPASVIDYTVSPAVFDCIEL